MQIKKIIYSTLLIIWIAIIFIFSNQNAKTSQSTSDKIASDIVDTVEIVTKKDISNGNKHEFINNTRFVIRKTAHFTLYLILGVLTYMVFSSYNISKPVIYSIIFCLLYACSDEFHQIFSDGRTAKLMDIFIDTSGGIIGNFISYAIKNRKNNS